MERDQKSELLKLFNEQAPIARTFGMTLSFNDEGSAIIDLPYNPDLDHAMGGIHGGIYATLVDNAGWFTSALSHKPGYWIATSELSVHYFKPAMKCSLRAVGKMIKKGKRLDVVEVHLYDEHSSLVAHAVGSFMALPNIST
ncbi:MAG: PaaI family thioesterase [Spirochaetota bacterium]|nr:PaaI family thioesterase [Spirochaetota bacterium]